MLIKNYFFSRIRTLNTRSGKYLCKRVHIHQVIFLSRFQFHYIACVFLNSYDISTRGEVSQKSAVLLTVLRSRRRRWQDSCNESLFFFFPSGVLTQQGFRGEHKGRYLLLRVAYFYGIYFMRDMKRTRRYLANVHASSNIFISLPKCRDLPPGIFKSALNL